MRNFSYIDSIDDYRYSVKGGWTPHSIADKRMMVLWLRFLTEINSNTKDIPADLLNDPEIGKAVEDLEVSGFTDAELRKGSVGAWSGVQEPS